MLVPLPRLQWSLTALTPIHFTRYYLSQSVLFCDDEIQGASMVEEALEYYHKYNEFFVDLCLQGACRARGSWLVTPMS